MSLFCHRVQRTFKPKTQTLAGIAGIWSRLCQPSTNERTGRLFFSCCINLIIICIDILCGFTSFQLNIYIFRNNFNVIYLTPFIFHNSCVSKNNSTVIKERMFKYVIFKTKLFTLWYICSWKYNNYCVLISFFDYLFMLYLILKYKVVISLLHL